MTVAVVSSVIANKVANGGNAWAVLNWVLGLRRLGIDVYLIEEITGGNCRDTQGNVARFEDSANLAYFRAVVDRFDLAGSSALICDGGQRVHGMDMAELRHLSADADVLINITGHLTIEALTQGPRRRVYVDFDPGFTQIWHAAGSAGPRLQGHDLYYTLGENIGSPSCPIPTAGIPWRPIRQPIVLETCIVDPSPDPARFTTVGSWRGPYGPVELNGRTLGLKVHEFRRILSLPGRSTARFEIALDIHPADGQDRESLEEAGWRLVDPRTVAADPETFDRYIRGSGGECTAAQGVYVHTNSGWFSDRSARYLASGRPVLVQDTGFAEHLPVGEGLVAWRTVDEAARGAEAILSEYSAHSRAARTLAEQYFDSDRILGRLMDEVEAADRHEAMMERPAHAYS
jgi:hypothetical protein